MRGLEKLLALGAGGPANGLDAFDAERFDDCARHKNHFHSSADSDEERQGLQFSVAPTRWMRFGLVVSDGLYYYVSPKACGRL